MMRLTWAMLAYYPSIWSVFTTVVVRVSAGVSSVLKVHFPLEQRMFATQIVSVRFPKLSAGTGRCSHFLPLADGFYGLGISMCSYRKELEATDLPCKYELGGWGDDNLFSIVCNCSLVPCFMPSERLCSPVFSV